MGEVIKFNSKSVKAEPMHDKPDGPYIAGTAFCISCRHEWSAISSQGQQWLQCPSCERMTGRYRFHVEPTDAVWTCGCGNDLFYLTKKGQSCASCGMGVTWS